MLHEHHHHHVITNSKQKELKEPLFGCSWILGAAHSQSPRGLPVLSVNKISSHFFLCIFWFFHCAKKKKLFTDIIIIYQKIINLQNLEGTFQLIKVTSTRSRNIPIIIISLSMLIILVTTPLSFCTVTIFFKNLNKYKNIYIYLIIKFLYFYILFKILIIYNFK